MPSSVRNIQKKKNRKQETKIQNCKKCKKCMRNWQSSKQQNSPKIVEFVKWHSIATMFGDIIEENSFAVLFRTPFKVKCKRNRKSRVVFLVAAGKISKSVMWCCVLISVMIALMWPYKAKARIHCACKVPKSEMQ